MELLIRIELILPPYEGGIPTKERSIWYPLEELNFLYLRVKQKHFRYAKRALGDEIVP